MAAPTFSVVANVTSVNGSAPGTHMIWMNTAFSDTATANNPGSFVYAGRISAQHTVAGTASTPSMVGGSNEVSWMELAYGTFRYSQSQPIGIYSAPGGSNAHAVFGTLVVKKADGTAAPDAVTNIAGTFTVQGGGTFPFTAKMVGTRMGFIVYWGDANGRPVPASTPGATAQARTLAQYLSLMRTKVEQLVPAFTPPQQFSITCFGDPFEHDLVAHEETVRILRRMGVNTALWLNMTPSGIPYNSFTTHHRQAALNAGMLDRVAVYLARTPGQGWKWKGAQAGDSPEPPTTQGHTDWANRIKGFVMAAGYSASALHRLVMSDEQAWQYPWELDIVNTGTFTWTIAGGGSQTGDSAMAKSMFQSYLQTLTDDEGNAVTPAFFGLSAWTDAAPVGRSKMNGTIQERRLYVASMDWFPTTISETYAEQTQALLTAVGSQLACGADLNSFHGRSCAPGNFLNYADPQSGGFSTHPDRSQAGFDWFIYGRKGSGTVLAVDGWMGDGVAFMWSNFASRMRSKSVPSGLIIPAYAERTNGLKQQFMALVGQGSKKFDLYKWGPEWSRNSESFSETMFTFPNRVQGPADAMRLISQTEDLLYPGQFVASASGTKKVAILYPRSPQHFDDFGGSEIQDITNASLTSLTVDWLVDAFGLYNLCQYMNVPVDWIDQDDLNATKLAEYGVVYVTAPNIPKPAQNALSTWTNGGGVLVTTVGAGKKDRWNADLATVSSLGGITEAARTRQAIENVYTLTLISGVAQPERFVDIYETANPSAPFKTYLGGKTANAADLRASVTGVASGDVVARFANDNAPAVVDVAVGTGRHIHFAYTPGIAWFQHGTSPSAALPVFNHVGVPSLTAMVVTRPLSYSNFKRPCEVDRAWVETNVLGSNAGWAIVVNNWTVTAFTGNYRVRLPFTPSAMAVTRSDGTTVPLTATGDGYTFQAATNDSSDVFRIYAATGSDTSPPTVSINQASGQSDPTSTSPINFTVVFSEPVTGFGNDDVILSGTAGATTAVVTGSGTTYNVAVSGMTQNGTVIASIPAGRAQDAAGNLNLASSSTDNVVTYDVSSPPPSGTVVPSGSPVVSEASTSLPHSFAYTVQAGTNRRLMVLLEGFDNAFTSAPSFTVTYAGQAMTLVGSATAGLAKLAVFTLAAPPVGTANVVITPDRNVNLTAFAQGFTGAHQIDFGSTVSASGTNTISVNVTSATSEQVVALLMVTGSTIDAVGSGQLDDTRSPGNDVAYSRKPGATTTTMTWTKTAGGSADVIAARIRAAEGASDTTPPTVTINKSAGQPDPTSSAPIFFDVVFSESVTGFTSADVSLAGSTAGGTLVVSISGSGATYTVSVTGMTTSGDVVAALPAGAAVDAANNPSLASTSTDNIVAWSPPVAASEIVTGAIPI